MVEGHEWEDWFQAEKEIRERLAAPAPNGLPTTADRTTKGTLQPPVSRAVSPSAKDRIDPGSKDSTGIAIFLFQALIVCLGILLILVAIIFAGKGEKASYSILHHLFAEVGAVIIAFGLLHLIYDRTFRQAFTKQTAEQLREILEQDIQVLRAYLEVSMSRSGTDIGGRLSEFSHDLGARMNQVESKFIESFRTYEKLMRAGIVTGYTELYRVDIQERFADEDVHEIKILKT
jgi:hypothetical protein